MAIVPAELNLDLTPGAWLLVLGATAVFSYVVSSIFAWWRLRQFNGPFSASFSYYWIMRACYGGEMAQRFAEVDKQFGSGPSSTVRIGPNELLTSDPDVIRRTSGARSKYTRSTWYKLNTVDPYDASMLNTLDTATHDTLKAQTAPGYAGKDNPALESEVDFILAQVIDKIRTKYATAKAQPGGERSNKPMLDLASMAQYFTLDSISKLAFGEEFGLVREERDIHGHIAMLDDVAATVVVVSGVPYLRAILGSDFALKLMGPKPGDKRGMGVLMGCVFHHCPHQTLHELTNGQPRTGKKIVEKRFGPDAKDQQDMLVCVSHPSPHHRGSASSQRDSY